MMHDATTPRARWDTVTDLQPPSRLARSQLAVAAHVDAAQEQAGDGSGEHEAGIRIVPGGKPRGL